MKRFVIAAALATVLGMGFAGTADAQYQYHWTTVTPNGGLATTNRYYTPFGYQTQNMYVSPFGNVQRSAYYGDAFGNVAGQRYGFSPSGATYNRGYYGVAPSIYNPYGATYNYNFYRRW